MNASLTSSFARVCVCWFVLCACAVAVFVAVAARFALAHLGESFARWLAFLQNWFLFISRTQSHAKVFFQQKVVVVEEKGQQKGPHVYGRFELSRSDHTIQPVLHASSDPHDFPILPLSRCTTYDSAQVTFDCGRAQEGRGASHSSR